MSNEITSNNSSYHINRQVVNTEINNPWSKSEYLLFLEFYEIVKKFFYGESNEFIYSYTSDNIIIEIPFLELNLGLFKGGNVYEQLLEISDRLTDKKFKKIVTNKNGGIESFGFVNLFTSVNFSENKNGAKIFKVTIPTSTYRSFFPMLSYVTLNKNNVLALNGGNKLSLYSIIKSYAFKGKFNISFNELREMLGFKQKDIYTQWKYFNNQVLAPAVDSINRMNAVNRDIEIMYTKPRNSSCIQFSVKVIKKDVGLKSQVLLKNAFLGTGYPSLNLVQNKFIDSVLSNLVNPTKIKHSDDFKLPEHRVDEIKDWIVFDVQQCQCKCKKTGKPFNWDHLINSISKQIRNGSYIKPHSYAKYFSGNSENIGYSFDEDIYMSIKKIWNYGSGTEEEVAINLKVIRDSYSDELIRACTFGHIL